VKTAAVLTHTRPSETRPALDALRAAAVDAGYELRFDAEETAKHELQAGDGIVVDASPDPEGVDLVVALGGDGTILKALRRFSGTGIPVYAVNYGEVGFLATVEPDGLREDFGRAFAGDFELLRLPAITITAPAGVQGAINDVALHRRPGDRVAVLAYELEGDEVGAVRCDGLVVATAAGSTGYNLANGGPVLAWGVPGFVVSFIAPHSLTARALVAAPSDTLRVHNRSIHDPVEISVDGRHAGQLNPDEALTCRFLPDAALLAQVPGTTFYRRLRDKFGALV
jgi:NAD+ kinase